jgi:hypothetical protein
MNNKTRRKHIIIIIKLELMIVPIKEIKIRKIIESICLSFTTLIISRFENISVKSPINKSISIINKVPKLKFKLKERSCKLKKKYNRERNVLKSKAIPKSKVESEFRFSLSSKFHNNKIPIRMIKIGVKEINNRMDGIFYGFPIIYFVFDLFLIIVS